MPKTKTAEEEFLAMFRERIVANANRVKELIKYAENWRMISLEVEDLLRTAEQNLVLAYQLLPDE